MKTISIKKSGIVLVFAILAGISFAAIKLFNTSSGVGISDAQAVFNQSILSLPTQNTAFEVTIIEGSHPWGIEETITKIGGESTLAETTIKTAKNTLHIYDSGEQIFATFTPIEALDSKNSISINYNQGTIVNKLYGLLENSGALVNLKSLLESEVEFTEDDNKFSAEINETSEITLPSVASMFFEKHRFTKYIPDASQTLQLVSAIYEINEETGIFESALLEYNYNNTSFTAKVSVIEYENEPEEIDPEKVISLSELLALDTNAQAQIAGELVGGRLHTQYGDMVKIIELEVLVDAIDIYAKTNLYYPTKIALYDYLAEQNLQDSTSFNLYTPLPEECDNSDENYCSSYEIPLDLGYDGFGAKDEDKDLRDFILTP